MLVIISIIDAINMLKGERTSHSIIRAGESKARVDGVFETDDQTASEIADITGAEAENELIISRQLSDDGKNSIRINGIPLNISMLKMTNPHIYSLGIYSLHYSSC